MKKSRKKTDSIATSITSSRQAYLFLKNKISLEQEEVWVLCLSSIKEVIACKKIFMGSLDSCPIHPREIFRFILFANSASFIFYHSHPSGDFQPSIEDIHITKRLKFLSELFQITMDDHIIISKRGYFSFSGSRLEPFC